MLVSPKKDPSFFVFADAVAFAQNKHLITLFNPAANTNRRVYGSAI